MPTFSSTKCKIQLKLSVQRTRLTIQKKEAMAKKARRDIATLIEKGKLETAKLRVEQIIVEDSAIELLELLELYCELLLARIGLLDLAGPCDPLIEEAVVGIIHAAPRTEINELQPLRDQFIVRYGRDYAVAAAENKDNIVSSRVISKLKVGVPDPDLVDLYLYEIAKAYEVDWVPESVKRAEKERKEKEERELRQLKEAAEAEDWMQAANLHKSPADLPPSQRAPSTPQALRVDLSKSGPTVEDDVGAGIDLPSTPPTDPIRSHGVTITTNLRSPTTTPSRPTASSASPAPAPKAAAADKTEKSDTVAAKKEKSGGDDLDVLAQRLAALKRL